MQSFKTNIYIKALISYNIIIGDTITKVSIRLFNGKLSRFIKQSLKIVNLFNFETKIVSKNSLLNNRVFVVCMVSLFVTLPLCLLKKISKLSKVTCLILNIWMRFRLIQSQFQIIGIFVFCLCLVISQKPNLNFTYSIVGFYKYKNKKEWNFNLLSYFYFSLNWDAQI